MRFDHGIKEVMPGLGQSALYDKESTQRLPLVKDPSVHGGDQGIAGNEVHLQRQDAKQEVAIGSGPIRRSRIGPWASRGRAEGDVDHTDMVREAMPILLSSRFFTRSLPQVALDRQQILQER